ncbi:MAG: hypothetical protein JNN19_05195, partial [Bacteroidia bacterium]|nr:hypothetical protein [Bacteroidia bacterium]
MHPKRFYRAFLLTLMVLGGSLATQAQTQITDYVLFGGFGNCPGGAGLSTPPSPGCAVQINSGSNIQAGRIGSYTLVKTTGNVLINGGIHSGRTISLATNNTVTGNITAANAGNASGNIMSAGSSTVITGNIDVNGNITISGGSVNGVVTRPSGKTYSGPTPTGGVVTASPNLPILPAAPTIVTFPAAGTTTINSTRTITPGSYGSVCLSGNKTLTLAGPGVYVFSSIRNSGSFNTFKFDFQNSASGNFLIYVHGDIDLNKNLVDIVNGGSASRIFTETHGTGSTCGSGPFSFLLANGTSGSRRSQWMGTVYAPYAGINVGTGSNNYASITGALWSGTQVNICSNVTIAFAPFIQCSTPNVSAGLDQSLTCLQPSASLNGSSSTAGVTYAWTSLNGNTITNAGSAVATVSAAGTYVLTVTTASGGCTARDTMVVTNNTSAPNANAGADQTITCGSTNASLTASSTTGGVSYSWSGPSIVSSGNSANATVDGPGTYTVTVTNTTTGCTATDQVQVGLNQTAPDAEAGNTNALTCTITELELKGSSATSGAQFSWTTTNGNIVADAGTDSPLINGIGMYYLTVTDPANGCTAIDSVSIEEGP